MTEHTKPATKRPRKMAREPKAEAAIVSEPLALPTNPKPQGKGAMVEQTLSASEGSTLAQLCEATGWPATHEPGLPHWPAKEGQGGRAGDG